MLHFLSTFKVCVWSRILGTLSKERVPICHTTLDRSQTITCVPIPEAFEACSPANPPNTSASRQRLPSNMQTASAAPHMVQRGLECTPSSEHTHLSGSLVTDSKSEPYSIIPPSTACTSGSTRAPSLCSTEYSRSVTVSSVVGTPSPPTMVDISDASVSVDADRVEMSVARVSSYLGMLHSY